MATSTASASEHRAISQLVCPNIEEPIPHDKVSSDRRRSHRYKRQLPASLIVGGTSSPVTCMDIGYGGMRIRAPRSSRVLIGERVVVSIPMGGRYYQDEFRVVERATTADSTELHLSL